ncbi:MAG TPA: OmpA family protein [Chitinophagaceae bacterium]|nr:OmpA family protein [Chitinophagaceae bacterium]
MRKVILGILLISSALVSFSQDVKIKNQYRKGKLLGVHFTFHDFQTAAELKENGLSEVLNDKQWYKTSRMSPGLAISYTQGLTDNIDFMGRLGGSLLAYPVPGKPASNNDKLLVEADANVNLKLLSDQYWVSPYISAGFGASAWQGYFGAYVPTGLGLQVNFFDETYLFLQAQYRIPVVSGTTASHLFYGFGLAGNIGKKKEVAPPPPPPPPVPADRDGDGIVDPNDKCPDVPGLAKYEGCPIPDSDKDGINDEQDKCPQVPGLAKYQGCPIPDTDKDGINDEEDKCPQVPGLARYQGCPIPDTDGDGINDEEDKCPTIPGIPENSGCPAINFKSENIQFVTGSATLTSGSKAELNKLVKILNQDYPEIKVVIEGHTDNTGKADKNQVLSEKRAESVKTYLASKKVAVERLSTAGYGADQPIADNATAAGRAKNRRVTFKVSQ